MTATDTQTVTICVTHAREKLQRKINRLLAMYSNYEVIIIDDEPRSIGTSAHYRDYRLRDFKIDIKPKVKTKNRGPVPNRGKGKGKRSYDG